MIGFVTNQVKAQSVLNRVRAAQLALGLPQFWSTGSYPVYTGEHAGKIFIPADEKILSTNLRLGRTPMDFPGAPPFFAVLGGLEARIDLDPQTLIDPDAPTDLG